MGPSNSIRTLTESISELQGKLSSNAELLTKFDFHCDLSDNYVNMGTQRGNRRRNSNITTADMKEAE